MKVSLALLGLAWSPITDCKLRGAPVTTKLRTLQDESEVQTIANKVTEKVQSYVEEGSYESPEIDVSGVAGVTENVLDQIKSAVGEENMTEEKVQANADKIADLIAAKYIDTEANKDGASATTNFDVSGLTNAISSVTIEIALDFEKTDAPSGAPTGSPTFTPTGAPTDAPTASPTSMPTVPTPAILSIVNKAVEKLKEYNDGKSEITLPELDTERISAIAETVFSQIEQEAGDEEVTEAYLEENADRVAELINTAFLEFEITENGEPVNMSEEDLTKLMSSITSATIKLSYEP